MAIVTIPVRWPANWGVSWYRNRQSAKSDIKTLSRAISYQGFLHFSGAKKHARKMTGCQLNVVENLQGFLMLRYNVKSLENFEVRWQGGCR
jgi:hypothetical protein